MTAQRSRKEEIEYHKYQVSLKTRGKKECAFCAVDKNSEQYITESRYFKIIRNIFPYSIWDNEVVQDHIMIVPKLHTDKLGALPNGAGNEFLKLIDTYENDGYNLYARAPGSNIKSIVHQHSHLIKPLGKRRKFIFYNKKPYIRISF